MDIHDITENVIFGQRVLKKNATGLCLATYIHWITLHISQTILLHRFTGGLHTWSAFFYLNPIVYTDTVIS